MHLIVFVRNWTPTWMMMPADEPTILNFCSSSVSVGNWKVVIFFVAFLDRLTTNCTLAFGSLVNFPFLFFIKRSFWVKANTNIADFIAPDAIILCYPRTRC